MTGMRRDNVLLNHCGFENCLYWRPYTAATGTVRADGGGREGDTKERAAKLGCDGDKGGKEGCLFDEDLLGGAIVEDEDVQALLEGGVAMAGGRVDEGVREVKRG